MKKVLCLCFVIAGLIGFNQGNASGQNSTMDDINLFQSFFRDTPISETGYGEGFFRYDNSDFLDITTIGARGGIGLTPDFEVGTGIFYRTLDFDEISNESGIADIPVFGRYNFLSDETKLSGGAFFTLPVGSEDIGQGNLDFGIYTALRHPVSEYVVLTGNLGVDFLETPIDDYEASLNLGGGIIYAANRDLSIIGEFTIQADTDFSALSGGIDYKLADSFRLRGNLLLGTDDGAPDFGLTGGLLFTY